MKPGLPIIAIACLTLSLSSDLLGAASVSSSFGVSATVESGCLAIASPGSLASSDGAKTGATPAVQVNCTNPTAYSVGFSPAAARGGTGSGRKVLGTGSALLDYVLVQGRAGKSDRAEAVTPESSVGIWSLDPHTLAKEIQQMKARADQSGTAPVYPDAITVTITY